MLSIHVAHPVEELFRSSDRTRDEINCYEVNRKYFGSALENCENNYDQLEVSGEFGLEYLHILEGNIHHFNRTDAKYPIYMQPGQPG